MEQPVVIFDGVCNLCNYWINYIIKHDRKQIFKFASLQGVYGSKINAMLIHDKIIVDSVILNDQGQILTHSDAILKICRLLGGVYSLAAVGLIIPKPIRDWIYNWIARNRYSWFGKKDSCMMPTPELMQRFLP